MHIKQITIQGFKSYKDQTTFDPFSPKHNVIVGRNGSGKSNFFAAIRFVLSDAYQSLSKEERQSLLHEGVGAATISAYVEIVFDNADNRFPTGKEEVVLRRSIGLTLDEYSLDGKSVTKSDVMNLLESAGFSRANPYYIVPQGRITSLTTAKDEDRLQLLKDIAGTRVYEQKRGESTKIMEETDAKRMKITEVLAYIQDRLAELEEEKEELSQFQTLDRERRSLEYTIYAREQSDANDKLEEMDEKRKELLKNSETKREEYADNEAAISTLETSIRDMHQSIELAEDEKIELNDDRADLMKRRAQLELLLKDLEDGQMSEEAYKAKVAQQLETIEQEISTTKETLDRLSPEYQSLEQKDQEYRQQLESLKSQQASLHAKQARLTRFASKAERDAWLQAQIQDIMTNVQTRQNQIQILEQEKLVLEKQLESKQQAIQSIRQKAAEQHAAHQQLAEEESRLKTARDDATEERKKLWREEAKLDSVIHNCNDEIRKAERMLAGSMDKKTSSGLAAVARITKERNLGGVYGPLFELFNVDERFNTAVEAAAGSSLFHVVVDTDATATQLLEALNQERSGRVTFIPLNRINHQTVDYPQTTDIIPLIRKLQFDSQFQKAFEQIFSRVILCRNLEIAASYAKSHGLTAVTLEGDRVDGRGALSGGYSDHRHSRLTAARQLKLNQDKLHQEQARLVQVKADISRLDQQVTQVLGELQVVETNKKKLQVREDALQDESKLKRDETHLRELLETKKKALDSIRGNVITLEQQMQSYQVELSSALSQTLSAEEQGLILQHSNTIEQVKRDMLEVSKAKSAAESEINRLRNALENDLLRRKEELVTKQDRVLVTSNTDELARKRKDYRSLERKLGRMTKKIEELDNDIAKKQQSLVESDKALQNLTSVQVEVGQTIRMYEKSLERLLLRKTLLLQKKEECNANIRDLGVLPEDAFEKYANLSVEKLLRRLHRTNESLQKYNHVNKKAFEQYGRFTKQRDQLTARKAELDKSADAISNLIDSLDRRKDEAIERTFQDVSNNFSEIFGTLVPAGRGELVMKHRTDEQPNDGMDVDDASTNQHGIFERYSGVSIRVSFNSKSDEGMIMQQLSGGQKSLVALALIFSIQKCDPAPFYLFDEIDANLDAQYRSAVADMIHEMSQSAQFITTTFRPELLANADKFYGVTFQGKVSRIHGIPKETAFSFVEQEHIH
ncbi:putative chromosome segregation protein SudA [Radiomyces spectabilis]|uniref:putative chromosome segregation protein SudA n=1 Tax=Radiomyces spectabilis TaxID=64574 RepID=UPI0022204CB8|nr:putative chromosome segregation protein SudA [Radiomyces spectabilis]KAI8370556.1 putative chromosome segregation protein SudA [Radiomyces spectabilis]